MRPHALGLALVMELVEGDTLAERLARGALPAGDALVVARQLPPAHPPGQFVVLMNWPRLGAS